MDILGDADIKRFELAVRTCIADHNVDGLVVIYTPQGTTQPTLVAEAVAKIAADRRKPMLTVWMGEKSVLEARQVFYRNNIPTYATPEEAVKSYMYMYRYRRNLDLLYETPEELPVDFAPPKSHLKVLIRKAAKNRTALTQPEVDRFLDAYNIPRAKGSLTKSPEEAAMVASDIGYPIVMKIASEDILHKTDIGGVITGIDSSEALKDSVQDAPRTGGESEA